MTEEEKCIGSSFVCVCVECLKEERLESHQGHYKEHSTYETYGLEMTSSIKNALAGIENNRVECCQCHGRSNACIYDPAAAVNIVVEERYTEAKLMSNGQRRR